MIFDSVGDGVAISEPGGRFLEVNRAVCERLGYTREELLNMPVSTINTSESAATIPGRVAEIMQGGAVQAIEATHVRRDGSEMRIEAVSRRITFHGKPAVLSVYRDITERKRAEDEIATSAARLQIAMGAMLDGVGILSSLRDSSGRVVDFRIDYANAAMGAISGVEAEEQVGHTLLELFPAHRLNGLFEAYVRVVETGLPFVSADFKYADPGAEGGPLEKVLDQRVARLGDGIILSVRDVTEVSRMRQERERLAAIVEESPDGMLVTGADQRILYLNSAFARDLGRNPAEVVGLGVLELVAGIADSAAVSAIVEAARSVKPWQGEADWRLPGGMPARFDLRITPRLAADGAIEGQLIVARDVTERRRIQTALELSELKYSTAFRTSPDAVNLNRLSDGLYLDISDGFTATTGFARDEVVGKTSAEIAIWADPETRDRLVDGLRSDGVVHNMAMRFRRKDGSLGDALMSARVIEVSGEPCILSITRDITDRKEAEERFRTLFEVANDSMMISEPGGKFLEVNATACERLGYSREELLTMSPADINAPGYAPLIPTRNEALMGGGSAFFDTVHLRRDGTLIPVEISATVIDLAGGKAILTIARDISERQRSEQERRALEEQLTQAQKLEAIGRLAGGVAHDFNNLLTAIRGFAELHLADHAEGDPGRDDVLEIVRAAERATQLTKGLLAFSRRAEVHPAPLDLAGLVHDAMALLRRLVGEDIEVHLRAGPKVPLVFADPVQVEQVLLNLAANARDAMPTGGSLGIEVKAVFLDDGFVAAHPGSQAGSHVLLAVSDTGMGMDEATQEHIFEPFFTTKPSGQGTGLGLASVYGIVTQAGGYIDVSSRLGGGAVFRAYLPAFEGSASPVKAARSPGHARTGAYQTILLVEDEPAVRLFAQRVLEGCGYSVLAFGDPNLALDFAIRDPNSYDALVTDVIMPVISGSKLAERIALVRPDLPVLFMSGYEAGAIPGAEPAPLAKPFGARDLVDAVATLFERKA